MANNAEIISLTDSQKDAVSVDPRLDRIVIAMAGSGKTTVLTEYYLALLDAGMNSDEIVAITFTEKAARSMRVKLVRRLMEQDRGDVARNLLTAPISTMHAFFGKLVRENSLVLGLDPDSAIIDEIKSSIMIEECIDSVMLRWRHENRADYDLLLTRLEWSGDPHTRFMDYWQNMKSFGFSAADLKSGPDEKPIFLSAKNELESCLDDFISESNSIEKPSDSQKRKLVMAYELVDIINPLQMSDLNYKITQQILEYQKRGKISGKFAKALEESGPALKEAIIGFVSNAHYIIGKEIRETFIKLISDFEREYQSEKESSRSLDYSDLEIHAKTLLSEHPEILSNLKQRYKIFLIDEFQDANPLQISIINMLRNENGFFAVGDPRQSIYGFRHADVGIMLSEIERFRKSVGEVIELGENFRSRSVILDSVSAMFHKRLIDPKLSNEQYGQITAGRKFNTESVANPVELIISTGDTVDEARDYEVSAVVNKLTSLLNEGMMVEGRDGNPHKLQPYDCAILFRTKSHMRDFSRALEDAAIPHTVTTGSGFYNQREVMDLINYLELITEPFQAQTFAEVLRAPFYGISADALYRIINGLKTTREKFGIKLAEKFWENKSIKLDKNDAARFSDLQNDFEFILKSSTGLGASERLNLILDKTHFKGASSKGKGGARKLANIGKLVDIADEWDREFPGNITGFINRMKELRFREVREPESVVSSSDNSVVLMTIHASKGLEFPLVILADATARGRNTTPSWLLNKDGQVILKSRDSSAGQYDSVEDFFYGIEKQNLKDAESREAVRLIYVALTRAMEKLIISMSVGKKTYGDFWDFFDASLGLAILNKNESTSCMAGDIEIPISRFAEPAESPNVTYKPEHVETRDIDIPRMIKRVESWRPSDFESKRTIYSISEFTNWLVCPMQYRFNYELGYGGLRNKIKLKDDSSISHDDTHDWEREHADSADVPVSATSRGTIIHELLQTVVEKKDDFSIDEYLQEIRSLSIKRDEINSIVDYFKSSRVGESLLKSDVVYLEKPIIFRMPDIDIPFKAIPDAVWMSDDKWYVVDYKSGRHHDESDITGRSYAAQVRMYVYSIESIPDVKVSRASLLYIDAQKEEVVDISDDAMRETSEKLKEFLASIETGKQDARKGESCEYCAYKTICSAYKESSDE